MFGEPLEVDLSRLLDNDIDLDNDLSVEDIVIVSTPENGTVSIVDGQLVFTPDPDVSGLVEFEYQLDVGGNLTETQRFFATVDEEAVIPTTAIIENDTTPQENNEQQEQEQQEQEEEEQEEQDLDGVTNMADDDDEQIDLQSSRSASNDIVDNAILEPIDQLENGFNETVFESQYAGATYSYTSRLDSLSLSHLTRTIVAEGEKVSEFEATYLAGLVWDDLDSAKQSYLLNGLQIGVPTIVSSAASFLTVGYLAWIVRGGVLLTTFMSSVPTWSSFDILSVLDEPGDDESIEQMVDQ